MQHVAAQHAMVQHDSLAKQAGNGWNQFVQSKQQSGTFLDSVLHLICLEQDLCSPPVWRHLLWHWRLQCDFRAITLSASQNMKVFSFLLQAASIGVSLCQSGSGVAAPFTSQHQSISCMLQGACCCKLHQMFMFYAGVLRPYVRNAK